MAGDQNFEDKKEEINPRQKAIQDFFYQEIKDTPLKRYFDDKLKEKGINSILVEGGKIDPAHFEILEDSLINCYAAAAIADIKQTCEEYKKYLFREMAKAGIDSLGRGQLKAGKEIFSSKRNSSLTKEHKDLIGKFDAVKAIEKHLNMESQTPFQKIISFEKNMQFYMACLEKPRGIVRSDNLDISTYEKIKSKYKETVHAIVKYFRDKLSADSKFRNLMESVRGAETTYEIRAALKPVTEHPYTSKFKKP